MKSTANNEEAKVTIASDLLQRHIQTLVADNAQWQTLIADDILWELAYAPSIGHPAQLSGREEAVRHAIWFVGAGEKLRFFELKVYALADRNVQSPKSRARGSSSLRDVCIARIMSYSCVPQAARSRSYENISILCVRLGHLTRRSLVSNPEDNGRAKSFVGQGLIPHLETILRPRSQQLVVVLCVHVADCGRLTAIRK